MSIPVVVLTSERYHWALRPFAYLFNLYWSELQPVVVVTDRLPAFQLPGNFQAESVSQGQPLPKERWSDGLMEALDHLPASHFVLLLEDYWLTRTVDHAGVQSLAYYAELHPNVLRVDLTDDRQYNGHAQDIEAWGHYDLVETPGTSEYQMSLQAGIWNRLLLRSVLRPGLSPWEVELQLSPELHGRKDLRVVGTRQSPLRYANVLKNSEQGQLQNLEHLARIIHLTYSFPLAELLKDYYDQLKSVSQGFATLDYELSGFYPADLVKLEVLVAGQPVDAMSQIVPRLSAPRVAKALVERLIDLIPRQQFEVAVQAAVGSKILARADVKAFRKDVTAKLYGGDQTRKDKLLKKQKKGKARMKRVGRVDIPQEAFLAILKVS